MNSGYDLPGGLGPVRERIIDDPWLFLSVALILLVVVYVVSLGLKEVIFSIRKGKGKKKTLLLLCNLLLLPALFPSFAALRCGFLFLTLAEKGKISKYHSGVETS